jgi:hypothetical protein
MFNRVPSGPRGSGCGIPSVRTRGALPRRLNRVPYGPRGSGYGMPAVRTRGALPRRLNRVPNGPRRLTLAPASRLTPQCADVVSLLSPSKAIPRRVAEPE